MEEQTVDLLKRGDSQAWEDVVLEYQAPLSRYLYNIVRDKELARDLTQDTFVEAYRGITKTRGELRFKSWLYRIATNNAIQVLRRRKIISWTTLTEEEHGCKDTGNIENGLAQRELVRDTLDRLPEKYRTILLLHDYQGFKCPEISGILDISPDAAKKRLARGRIMFRDIYEQIRWGG